MLTWRPNDIKPTVGPKPPKRAPKGAPVLGGDDGALADAVRREARPNPKRAKGTGAQRPKGPPATPKAPRPWYDPSQTAARDAAIDKAFRNPLKPVDGETARAFAKALADARLAPVLLDYDRQQQAAASRAADQTKRQAQGTAAMQAQMAEQLATQQAAQSRAREQIAGAGSQLSASVDQSSAAAQRAVAADVASRGAGLDGGASAQAAQEAASAKARGAAGTQIALDQQASQAASGDALLRQISAATGQQGGERQGAITAALNAQLRDLNQSRTRDVSSAQSDYVKSLLDLQGQNIQTSLATQTLGLDQAKLESANANATAERKQQARDKALDRYERAKDRAQRAKQFYDGLDATTSARDRDRASREMIAANREAAAAKRAAAAGRKGAPKLTPKDNRRRSFIDNVNAYEQAGTLGNLKSQAVRRNPAKAPSTFRAMLANRGIKDQFTRQLLTDLAFGGLRPGTVAAYRTLYGRNPPTEWTRYRPKKAGRAAAAGVGATASGSAGVD